MARSKRASVPPPVDGARLFLSAPEAPSAPPEAPSEASEAPSEAPSEASEAPSEASEAPSAPSAPSEAPSAPSEAPSEASEATATALRAAIAHPTLSAVLVDTILSAVPEADRARILTMALLTPFPIPNGAPTVRATRSRADKPARVETQILSRDGRAKPAGTPRAVPVARGSASDDRARDLLALATDLGRPLTAEDVRGLVPDAALGWGTLWRATGSIGAALARAGFVARYRHPGGVLADLTFEPIEAPAPAPKGSV